MKILIVLITITFINIFSQTDWQRWEKKDISYKIESNYRQRDYSFKNKDAGEIITQSIAYAYWIFISDLDGDNCPFSPSCSAFLLKSVKETNIFQGTLMFFDRFTRDTNVYYRHKHYPQIKSGKFYDPPSLYTLSEDKINYIRPGFKFENE